jgi:diguanylate cyclase (GGDEF)-like protein
VPDFRVTNPPPEWPLPPDESERVAALHGLGVLDQPQNAELDGLTRLASFICGTPVAVINLVDADRQWQASAHGAEPGEVSRSESMCGRSVLSRDVTYTPDASRDPDFAGSPHVTGELARIRMFAAAPLITSSGHVIGTLCAFDDEPRDLTRLQVERLRDLAASTVRLLELRRTAGDLADAATRDPLTGLPNRALLTESLGRAFARMTRSITDPGVLFVDLDGFKAVNDTHGHAAGDAVLRDVTERLLLCVRASDLVARLGGDEFVILVEESPAVGGAEDRLALLAARVREALDVTVTLHDGARVRLGASVGLAHSTGPDDTPDALLERADAAMYDDKARRRAGR